MVIVVPTFYQPIYDAKPFTVTEGLYKSVCGGFVMRIDDPTGVSLEPIITSEGKKFKLWKYKDWHGDWTTL